MLAQLFSMHDQRGKHQPSHTPDVHNTFVPSKCHAKQQLSIAHSTLDVGMHISAVCQYELVLMVVSQTRLMLL